MGDSSISSGELTNTLVFYVTTGPVNGALDNISLQQVFTGFEALTVSYSESVRGWVSFKSFILEQGYSLANNYYTFKNGGLFMHNSKAVSRNQFYGFPYPTSITTVLNIEPSTVKSFNTLNYEGSQSKVLQFTSPNTLQQYNEESKLGWTVEYIKTDKQEGSVKEFIEKEGKWFNYIKGKASTTNTSDLSFQGIGIATNVN